MTKEYITANWELDWDNDQMYFQVTKKGTIQKYDIENDLFYEYQIERVAH